MHHPASGSYTHERHDLPILLDRLLLHAQDLPYRNVACFMGLGNHGGHPTRRHIAEVARWGTEHPEAELVFSTLTRFGDALRAESQASPEELFPVHSAEINFAPRGIYAANARFKFAYRKVEAALQRADRLATAVSAATGSAPPNLREPWEALLFNTFHDILPGSSIERVFDEQLDWLGSAAHAVRKTEQQAIQALVARVDTRVRPPAADMPSGVPILAFNPHPWPYTGELELEANLDYRPIWKYASCPDELPAAVRDPQQGLLPYQFIETENIYVPRINFRKRLVVPVEIPALGWKLLEYAYDEQAVKTPIQSAVSAQGSSIQNGTWQVSARVGEEGVTILRAGQPLFSDLGLQALTVEDPWGPWGDFEDSPASLSLTEVRQVWKVTRAEVTESGPLRACLRVRLEAGRSRLDLAFSLFHNRDAVDVRARVLWDERCARLKLAFPGHFTSAAYAVMGGSVERPSCGEVPGGRWARLRGGLLPFGFASDGLYGFNLTPAGVFQATIARASRYTHEGQAQLDEYPWYPVMDCGELRFRFLLAAGPDGLENLERLADELEQPPLAVQVSPAQGSWAPSGSLASLAPNTLQLLTLKPAENQDGWILRLQSHDPAPVTPRWTWQGQEMSLATLQPHQIATYLFRPEGGAYTAAPVHLSILEEPDETF